MHLPVDDHRVEHRPAVLAADDALQVDLAGVDVDLDDRHDRPVGVRLRRVVRAGRGERRLHVGRPCLAAVVRQAADLLHRHRLAGHALHAGLAVDELDVLRADLHCVRGDAHDLLAHLLASAHDRPTSDDRGAARVGARAVDGEGGVVLDHADALERHAQRVGRDLRKRRVVRLPVVVATSGDGHGAVRLDRDLRRVEELGREAVRLRDLGAPRGRLDIRAEPDAEITALFAEAALLLSQRLVVHHLHRLADRRAVAAAVVLHPGHRDERLVGNGVLQPQLRRVLAQLAGDVVDHRLARRVPGRPADAAVRADRAPVGHRAVDGVPDRLDVVDAREERRSRERVDQGRPRVGRPGAADADVAALERKELAVLVDGDLEVADDLLRVRRGREVFVAVLDPLDREAEDLRGCGDDRLLVEDVRLHPEATAHVVGDDAVLALRDPERPRRERSHEVRDLGGAPHGELAGRVVVVGDHAAQLERGRHEAAVMEPLLEDAGRAGEEAVEVAALELDVREVVRAQLLVDEGRAVLHDRLGIHKYLERLPLDLDGVHPVLGRVARGCDHQHERLADVERPLRVHHGPRDGEHLGARERRRVLPADLVDVFLGEDGDDALDGLRRSRVDAQDLGVRVRAAEERGMEQPRQMHVIRVLGPAGQEERVLGAQHAHADVLLAAHNVGRLDPPLDVPTEVQVLCVCHVMPSFYAWESFCAASCTARTTPT